MGGFMWIAVTLSNSNKDKIVEYIEMFYQKYGEKIILTLNSSFSFDETFITLYAILDKIRIKNVPIQIGPQFLEDGFVIENKLETREELYFTTLGERIIWFLKNYKESFNFDKIILVEDTLGVDPIIMKRNGIDCDLYFVYNHKVIEAIDELIDNQKYHFMKLERKR